MNKERPAENCGFSREIWVIGGDVFCEFFQGAMANLVITNDGR